MFETYSHAKVEIPEGLREPDEHAWWYVKLNLHIPWFYVTCDINYGNDEILTQMLLITQVEHLLEVKKSKSHMIKHIDLVIPNKMNGGDKWKMSPLSEIWVGKEPDIDCPQEAFVYVLGDGNSFVDSVLNTKKDDLLDVKKIFSHNQSYS